MAYRIAGIDVLKKMLAVVVADVEVESEYQFERNVFLALLGIQDLASGHGNGMPTSMEEGCR